MSKLRGILNVVSIIFLFLLVILFAFTIICFAFMALVVAVKGLPFMIANQTAIKVAAGVVTIGLIVYSTYTTYKEYN